MNPGDPVYVYALVDPNTAQIRYVGISRNPRQRLSAHLSLCRRGRMVRDRWLAQWVAAGWKPHLAPHSAVNRIDLQSFLCVVQTREQRIGPLTWNPISCTLVHISVDGQWHEL